MVRVRVRAKAQRGFWRAGIFWAREWTEQDLDDDRALQVLAEPNLEASIVEKPTPGTPAASERQPVPDPPRLEQYGEPTAAPEEDDAARIPMAKPGQQARRTKRPTKR